MAGILLVHGGWHRPWCWDGFAERLTGHGIGSPLVLLCGQGGRAGVWLPAIAELVRTYPVVAR